MKEVIPAITVDTEDGPLTYEIERNEGGVKVSIPDTGQLVIYMTRTPEYVYPLLKVLAERCPDLVVGR